MPATVFLPLAAASVLDVAGVLAVVVMLPVAVAFVCFCCSQLLQGILAVADLHVVVQEQCSPAVTVQIRCSTSVMHIILMAYVVKILYFIIENTLAE